MKHLLFSGAVARLAILATWLSLWLATPALSAAETTNKVAKPIIYDVHADARKQIAEALAKAKQEHKRVLLKFGANWCGWCHRLHRLFEQDPLIAALLKEKYLVVMVDVDQGHNAEVVKKYDNPVRFGLPVLVVLDEDGNVLTTQDTGKLEEGDHHSPQKVLAFLKEWQPQAAATQK
jgi:thiol:disulfide interchange protein